MLDHIIDRIGAAEIQQHPFAHVVIDGLLPEEAYQAVLAALPSTETMTKVEYSGTGHGRRQGPQYRDYGFDFPGFHEATGALGDLRAALADPRFSRALLDKFVDDIPAEKHRFFEECDDYVTEFDVRVDLPGYAIPPHSDLPAKIVTFLFYLAPDDRLREHGTLLCEPLDDRAWRGRTAMMCRIAGVLERIPHQSAPYRRIARSGLGSRLGVGQGAWKPWSWFRVASKVPALPNHFLAFAPCDRSFHAVTLDDLEGERPVVRGFIRSGSNVQNWTAPHGSVRGSWRAWGRAVRKLVSDLLGRRRR